jgi:small subunit ribosomal protein S20
MPNLASAKKRLRQNSKRKLVNQIVKTRIKTETKKAAAKGIIHKNAAARRKSRLAKSAAASE